jgi:hypothetical protein
VIGGAVVESCSAQSCSWSRRATARTASSLVVPDDLVPGRDKHEVSHDQRRHEVLAPVEGERVLRDDVTVGDVEAVQRVVAAFDRIG